MGKTFLLDLDGTVYLDSQIIDFADKEIVRLYGLGSNFIYMTNNTSRSCDFYFQKLLGLGLPVTQSSIVSPTKVVSKWLRKNNIKNAFVVGTSEFQRELFALSGVNCDHSKPQCVIVGFDVELDYEKLCKACQFINAGTPYYLTHLDKNCPTRNGPIPDCGAIGGLIQLATNRTHRGHFGKPGELYTQYLSGLINLNDEVVVVGDREYTDGAIGVKMKAKTVLVRSGEFDGLSKFTAEEVSIFNTLSSFLKTVN